MRMLMRSTPRGLRTAVWLMLASMLCLPVRVAAQEASQEERTPEPPADLADVLTAQGFLFAAYPDLVGRDLEMRFRRETGAVLVSVIDRGATPATEGVAAPLLTARVEYGAGLELRRYDAYGPLVHEAENLALQTELLANPRWIESDADAWLGARGAVSTFGAPSATVTSRAEVVAARVGAQPMAGARFEWHTGATTAAGGRVFRSRPAWVTEAAGAGADGQARVYQFEYEPFGGRLIAVTVQEGGR